MVNKTVSVVLALLMLLMVPSLVNADTMWLTATTYQSGIWYDNDYTQTNDEYQISNELFPFQFEKFVVDQIESITRIKLSYHDHRNLVYDFDKPWFNNSELVLDGIRTGIKTGGYNSDGSKYLGGNLSQDEETQRTVLDALCDDGLLSASFHNPFALIYNNGGYLIFPFTELTTLELEVEVAPVPEPSTVILLGAGLAGLIGYRRKRKIEVDSKS